jgi:hypothetical protein
MSAIATVVTVISFAIARRDRRRKLVYYSLSSVTPLISNHSEARKIEVTYNKSPVGDPYVVRISVLVRSPAAVTAASFDRGLPLSFEIDAKIVELLSETHLPFGVAPPPVKQLGQTDIGIGPAMLHRSYACEIELLTDGGPSKLTPRNPIEDYDVLPMPSDADTRKSYFWRFLGWFGLALLIFYIGTNPGPAADIARFIGAEASNLFKTLGFG